MGFSLGLSIANAQARHVNHDTLDGTAQGERRPTSTYPYFSLYRKQGVSDPLNLTSWFTQMEIKRSNVLASRKIVMHVF